MFILKITFWREKACLIRYHEEITPVGKTTSAKNYNEVFNRNSIDSGRSEDRRRETQIKWPRYMVFFTHCRRRRTHPRICAFKDHTWPSMPVRNFKIYFNPFSPPALSLFSRSFQHQRNLFIADFLRPTYGICSFQRLGTRNSTQDSGICSVLRCWQALTNGQLGAIGCF